MDKTRKSIDFYMTRMPHSIEPHQTIKTARHKMQEVHAQHLPVLSGRKIVGVLSYRDLAYLGTFKNIDVDHLTVADVMISDPYTVTEQTSLKEVAAYMAENHLGSALVKGQGGELVGIFTATDALRALADLAQ